MTNYIDGFAFPVPMVHLSEYKSASTKVAQIWKEHGAITYFEYVGDDLFLEGTRAFGEALMARDEETIVFGWITFESKEKRDKANALVAKDSRMKTLIDPLVNSSKLIFDAQRMVYGGFRPLVTE